MRVRAASKRVFSPIYFARTGFAPYLFAMHALAASFSLLVAASGWFYMFYSSAAGRLLEVEGEAANRARIRLRRLNGFVMFVLAVVFYAGFSALDLDHAAPRLLLAWAFAILILLGTILVLALADVRQTLKLKRGRIRKGTDILRHRDP